MGKLDLDMFTNAEKDDMLAAILLYLRDTDDVRISSGDAWAIVDTGDDGYWIAVYGRKAYARNTKSLYGGMDFDQAFCAMDRFNDD